MTRRRSLRQRILFGVLCYVVALTALVSAHGLLVNENAERLVWHTLLESELDHLIERSRRDADYRWVDSSNIALFDSRQRALPEPLARLPAGVYDELPIDGIERVALVRDMDGYRLALVLDITEIENREWKTGLAVIGSTIVMITLIGIAIAWGVDRLLRPLSTLASRIAGLRPDRTGQRIAVPETATTELVVIADALNDYLERNDRFVERERAFIDMASHELRTPIAIIAGASEIALHEGEDGRAARGQLLRIRQTARDMERLIALLLMLARDPARLATISEPVALAGVLDATVEAHRHLMSEKDLVLHVERDDDCEIVAPLPIVQAAVGNLLRNAIENSDRGTIRISLTRPATITIADPGHGMTPEEIGVIYARMARGGGERLGSGIGLELIARLCDHLGWTLDMRSEPNRGTVAVLRFVAPPG